MKRELMIAAVAAGVMLASAPVKAQPLDVAQAGWMIPRYEVRTIVRSAGLDPIGPVVLRGRNYVLRAIDDEGDMVRVVVDARHGEVLAIDPVRRLPRFGGERRIVAVPPIGEEPPVTFRAPDVEEPEPPLRPPQVIRAVPEKPSAKATSRKPPLPRPRPADASLASAADKLPATKPAPPPPEVTGSVPQQKPVEVPDVAPLDPTAHGPGAN